MLRRLAVVNVFIAFLWLTVPLTSGGDVIAAWGPLEVSRAGVLLTLLVTIKSNAIVMTFLALVATMDSPTIGYALERLRFPSKLVFLFLFTYRYLHVIADEWHKLHGAARLRGFAPKTNMHTYRTFGNMLGMVFVHSFDRSVRVYEAMSCAGFSGRFQSVTAFRHIPRCRVRRGGVLRAWFASWPLICIWSFPVAEPIFALEHISFTYPGGRQVFRDMDFALYPDRKIGLYGPNGSGKTTVFPVDHGAGGTAGRPYPLSRASAGNGKGLSGIALQGGLGPPARRGSAFLSHGVGRRGLWAAESWLHSGRSPGSCGVHAGAARAGRVRKPADAPPVRGREETGLSGYGPCDGAGSLAARRAHQRAGPEAGSGSSAS